MCIFWKQGQPTLFSEIMFPNKGQKFPPGNTNTYWGSKDPTKQILLDVLWAPLFPTNICVSWWELFSFGRLLLLEKYTNCWQSSDEQLTLNGILTKLLELIMFHNHTQNFIMRNVIFIVNSLHFYFLSTRNNSQ